MIGVEVDCVEKALQGAEADGADVTCVVVSNVDERGVLDFSRLPKRSSKLDFVPPKLAGEFCSSHLARVLESAL